MKDKILVCMFWVFVGVGFSAFVILVVHAWDLYYCEIKDDFYKVLPAILISLSALIASFSVIRNIIENKRIKQGIELKEKEKNEKIIEAYFDFIKKEIKILIEQSSSVKCSFESHQMDEIIYNKFNTKILMIKDRSNKLKESVDLLMDNSLHKYTDKELIKFIFGFKHKMLDINLIIDILISDMIEKDFTVKKEEKKKQKINLLSDYRKELEGLNKELSEVKFN